MTTPNGFGLELRNIHSSRPQSRSGLYSFDLGDEDVTHYRSSESDIAPVRSRDEDSDSIPNALPPISPGNNADNGQYLSGIPLFTLLAGLSMAAFLLMIDSTVLVTSIPTITDYFDSTKDVGWYGSAYLVATCGFQLFFGKIYDMYNSKLTFISVFVLFEIGSLICATARSSMMFIMGRVVSGVGGAGILNGAFTIIAAATPLESRPKFIGIVLGIASTGVALGPLLGGILTQRASWRWCFYLNLPTGALSIVTLTLNHIPDTRLRGHNQKLRIAEQIHRLDFPGLFLFAGSVVMLLLGVDWGGVDFAWSSPTIINLFWGAGCVGILFIWWENRQGDNAMMPTELFTYREITFAAAASFMSYGGLYAIIIYLPLWFQAVKGVSPLQSGVYYLPSVITTTIGTIMSGFLVSVVGYYTPFMIAGGVLATIAAGLMTTLSPTSPVAAWVCYQLLNGVARGMLSQQPVTAVQANLPKHQLSRGTAVVVFCQNFGASIFISLGQTAFENSLVHNLVAKAHGVDFNKVTNAGATNFRDTVPAQLLSKVVLAYNDALTTTFFLSVGSSAAVFALAWGMGWTSVKKNKAR